MSLWGVHRNALCKKKFCCNLFWVYLYFDWTIHGCNKTKSDQDCKNANYAIDKRFIMLSLQKQYIIYIMTRLKT